MRACKDTHLAAAFEDEKAIALGEISRTERDREEAKRFRAVCRAEYGNEPESLNQYLSAVHTSGGTRLVWCCSVCAQRSFPDDTLQHPAHCCTSLPDCNSPLAAGINSLNRHKSANKEYELSEAHCSSF
jgi:rubrerythrin